jgi:hypothetical protein
LKICIGAPDPIARRRILTPPFRQGAIDGHEQALHLPQLKDDSFRGRVFGAGELRLEDWFVPVLFQEKEEPPALQRHPSAADP